VRRAVSVCGLNYRREDQRFGVWFCAEWKVELLCSCHEGMCGE
jgi:hypothetical protein